MPETKGLSLESLAEGLSRHARPSFDAGRAHDEPRGLG
jgi:hypothetical protein